MRTRLFLCVASICLFASVPRSIAQPVDTKQVRFQLNHVENIRPNDTLAVVNGQPLRAEEVFIFLGPKLGSWWNDGTLDYGRSKAGMADINRLFTAAIEDLVIYQELEKRFLKFDQEKNLSLSVSLRQMLEKQSPKLVDIAAKEYTLTEWLESDTNRREILTRAVKRKFQDEVFVGMILMAHVTGPRPEATLRKYHQSHADSFRTVIQVKWQQITLRRDTHNTDEEHRAAVLEVQKLLATRKRGARPMEEVHQAADPEVRKEFVKSQFEFVTESQFEQVASQHSEDEYQGHGGRRISNSLESIEPEAIRNILLTGEKNVIITLRGANNTMLIRIIDRQDEPSSFEKAKEEVKDHYVEHNKLRYRQQLFDELRKTSKIDIPTRSIATTKTSD